jgi:processive 1,2-diacylglycerol beta-glucosyltransferase
MNAGNSPRILVLSASVGAGHLRAAQAVELALREVAPEAIVQNLDVLTLTNAAFRKLYGQAYLELVNDAPHVLGYMYDLMDRPRRPKSRRDRLRLLVERLNLSKLCDVLQCQSWDVIVNTHFLPAEIIAQLKRKRKIKTPQMVVTTDFETHRLWVYEPVEHYTTATEEGAAYLKHWGVKSSISVTGIPIHPVFAKPKSRESCAKAHGSAVGLPAASASARFRRFISRSSPSTNPSRSSSSPEKTPKQKPSLSGFRFPRDIGPKSSASRPKLTS